MFYIQRTWIRLNQYREFRKNTGLKIFIKIIKHASGKFSLFSHTVIFKRLILWFIEIGNLLNFIASNLMKINTKKSIYHSLWSNM